MDPVDVTVDVAVIGGGPAGLATTLRLRELGRSVIVLEQSDYDDVRVGEHLSAAGVDALDRLGAVHIAREPSHLSSPGIRSIWGAGEALEVPSIFQASGAGLHLDRPRFEQLMAQELAQRDGRVLCRRRVVDVKSDPAGWRLYVDGPSGQEQIDTRVVVDASGRRAWLARRLGARSVRRDTLIGLALELPLAHGTVMPLVEAVEDGWWYSAPLPKGKLIAIYFTDADLRSDGDLMTSWRAALENAAATRERMGAASNRPRGFPAQSQMLEPPGGSRWIAVGDASAAMDPLASMGLTRALETGSQGGDAVHALLENDEAPTRQYASALRALFRNYCVERGRFYRLEQRWPDAPFWKRRHRSADQDAIWLDADALLTLAGSEAKLTASLHTIAPDMTSGDILPFKQGAIPAHYLATRLRAGGGYSDLEIISALQWLVTEGCLAVAEPTSRDACSSMSSASSNRSTTRQSSLID